MKTPLLLLGSFAAAALAGSAPSASRPSPTQSSIPYVATRSDAVRDMLWMANVGKDDVVYDLGSGDGRVVIAAVRDFGARRAVGIDIDPQRIRESREHAKKAGVADRVEFIEGDLFASDFREATVVALFLGHQPNIKLRPRLFSTLKPGTRIVSHQFAMGEWEPDKSQTVRTTALGMWGEAASQFGNNTRVPDYAANESHFGMTDKISVWIVPAPIAGIWRGKIDIAQGPHDFQMTLHQRLSTVSGTFQISGKTDMAGGIRTDLWGDHIRCWCSPNHVAFGQFDLRFDGNVQGDTMTGTLAVYEAGQLSETKAWQARRDKTDYTGTWEWSCPSGPRSVRLRIDKRDGRLVATYIDGDQQTPVTDIYDFGGGFYFTILIGRNNDGSIVVTDDTGWLIGEAILENGTLNGNIEFHPWRQKPANPDDTPARFIPQKWEPSLIKE